VPWWPRGFSRDSVEVLIAMRQDEGSVRGAKNSRFVTLGSGSDALSLFPLDS
jgi:hypothetical protein